MNYLVTGGMGFIGSYVVRLLLNQGHYVSIFDQKPGVVLPDYVHLNSNSGILHIYHGDITELDDIIAVCRNNAFDAIIHTAAIINTEYPSLTTKVNCAGTVNVLETARLCNIKKVVNTSSIAVFGPPEKYKEDYIANDARHFPENIYGASKSFGEQCIDYYCNKFSLDAISIRLAHVYGVGRRTKGIGKLIDDELFVKPALGYVGRVPDSDSIHNWMYVEDAARALVLASRVSHTNSRAFTAGGHYCSIKDMAAYIKLVIPQAEFELLPGKSSYAFRFDMKPIKDEIGYEPVWSLDSAVEVIINQIRNKA